MGSTLSEPVAFLVFRASRQVRTSVTLGGSMLTSLDRDVASVRSYINECFLPAKLLLEIFGPPGESLLLAI